MSIKELAKTQLQPLIDRLADLLPGWKAELMTKVGRATMVQFVLTATVIYHAMALDLPSWAIKAIEKIMRGFLWKGRKEAQGGHCLIAWQRVARPKELGGLGISNIQSLGWALRVWRLWLRKTKPNKPWANLPMQASSQVQAICSMAMATEVRDDRNTLFWQDWWILGQRLEDVTPLIHSMVPKRTTNRRTVREALIDMVWIQDIHGVATAEVIIEFLHLCNIISERVLLQDTPDVHYWRLSSSRTYSAKSAY